MHNALRLDGLRKSPAFFNAISVGVDWLAEQLFLQRKDSILWAPVFLAIGIGSYFSLLFEPPIALSLLCLLIIFGMQYLFRIKALWILTLIISGFFLANLRTVIIDAPMIEKKLGPVDIIGTIESIESMEAGKGSRITLNDLSIEHLSADKTPRKIRLRLRNDKDIAIGQRIDVLAVLNPPSSPLYPSGFDFRQYMYFKQIGAVGFIYRVNNTISTPSDYRISSESLRYAIAQKIKGALPERQAGVALALMIGKKRAISEDDNENIRNAGLAHMLAISGLHIGIFAGTIFFIIRFALSSSEKVSLQYSSKKIAAVFAIIASIFYMFIAGSTIPTQRAVLMSGVVFIAIICDRSPISLRLVALSAFVVLVFSPESLLSASFQMSFAAVTALVFFYDRTRHFWIKIYNDVSLVKKITLYFIGVCLTTVIASIATAPFALYHFGQVSFLGSVSNLVAVPLLAFIIMPSAILALALMPLGLHYYPLYIMGLGINGVLDVAQWANTIPFAVIHSAAWPLTSFVLFICFMLWIILWKGYGRICALIFMLSSFAFSHSDMPDILVSSSSKLMGVYHGDTLYVSSLRSERFSKENWESFYGLEEGQSKALRFKGSEKSNEVFHCGEVGCRFQIHNKKISFIRDFYSQNEECDWADIFISQEPVFNENKCHAPIIIDKFATWKNGAYAVYISDTGTDVAVQNVADYVGNRPWSQFRK